jgi:hypothetical protein
MRVLFFIFIFVLFHSCQKDDDSGSPFCDYPPLPCEQKVSFIPFQDTCFLYDFPDLENPVWNLVSDIAYYLPVLNPLNAEEFLYFKIDTVQPLSHFNRLDFCSGGKTTIYTDLDYSGLGRPIWGENDWLVFTGFDDDQVWKMKSNGDSLQQVTFFPRIVNRPTWINEGNNILVSTKLDGDPYNRNYILTPNGEVVDTIDAPILYPHDLNGKLATTWPSSGERFIGYYDLNTKELHPVSGVTLGEHPPFYINWLDENNIMWAEPKVGLQRVNIQTGEVTMLVEECDNRHIRDAATSPIHDGIIYFTEVHNLILDSALYHNQSRIYKMDAFTGEQWLVDLEE